MPDANGDVEGVEVRHLAGLSAASPFLTPEMRAEYQEKRRGTYDAERARASELAAARRQKAADAVEQAVGDAIESDMFSGKTNEELADLIVYRAAKIVLNGGPLFNPTNLKEVTELAKVWENVAASEAARRRGKLPNEPTSDPVKDAMERMKELRVVAAKRARSKGA